MDFRYTDEQRALQDTLERFRARDYGFEHRRELIRSALGYSLDAWNQYAELGLLALPIAEAHGGLGGNAIDVAIVMEQIGRGLLLEPYLSTVVLGAGLIAALGSSEQQSSLEAVAAGNSQLALAHGEPGARFDPFHVETRATALNDGWVISGHKCVVLDAPSADRFIVSARTSGSTGEESGISLFLIDPDTAGLSMRAYATQDGRRAADLRLHSARVGSDALLGRVGDAGPALLQALDKAAAALCSEAVGIMSALNQATVDYLDTRKQFGTPIGSFQALRHRIADMLISTEQARSMAILAAYHADDRDAAERGRMISAAKAYIDQAARFVGQQAVQLHGGMGVVDELVVSHYFKRLTVIAHCFGDQDHHLDRYSRSLSAA
ncbi:acyl-CoA dehydrogenase family protein [Hydrocarboniphaga effusa]|jgi:alkylation response protein AidB-like acyl-CoA dehydrogenase|uniref:acyl-CoA dehydrogenase family protein n=1 Tax=Hydrocarboniphaga effusa TaxID=243629 RepID=UPI00313845D6